jgi:acyl-lipid omega-6 desaturase (Delta-12 desaturase)
MESSSRSGLDPIMPQVEQIFARAEAFQAPILARSLGQLATSFGGFFVICAAMYLTLAVSVWITLPLSVLAAGFLVRIFIIQHDCGHGSFFRSRRANELIGSLCSLMTLTPYAFWRRQHARHHGSWNNLDRRAASGLDIYSSCMTVAEYRALGRWRRCVARVTNHPVVANLLLPPVVFFFLYRVPFDAAKGWRRERRGIYLTNLALAVLIGGLGLILGYGRVAAVQLPIMVIASIIGVWLFSIQHRFEHAQWMPGASWSFAAASLGGTSHLRLPRLLQWFTGNIGFHHVHHINPRIPNYRLEECHNADAGFQTASTLTLRTALQAMSYALWDSDLKRLVPFRFAAAGRMAGPRRVCRAGRTGQP